MSQIQNKVRWCLKKAEKEIKEGKRHRGLVRREPSYKEAKTHMKKAEHNLLATIAFERIGFSDWSVSAAFYSIYHCFLAILAKEGFESANQECTFALITALKEEKRTNIDEEIIEAMQKSEIEEAHENSIIEMREDYQYGTSLSIEDDRIRRLTDLCRRAYMIAQKEIANI